MLHSLLVLAHVLQSEWSDPRCGHNTCQMHCTGQSGQTAWHQVQHDACRYLQATAALIQQSGSSMQPKLLHLIAWLPAHRFGTFSMSLAVFAWHWIFAESPDLQVGSPMSVNKSDRIPDEPADIRCVQCKALSRLFRASRVKQFKFNL